MDMFASLNAFVTVVNEGAFARAARRLGVATSSVTRQVDSLEDHLHTVLINRSTRRLTLTDVGIEYYDSAIQIIQDLAEANANVALNADRPHGLLRVNLPVAFGQIHISPKLPKFLSRYPDIELDITLTDEVVNLIEDRVDVAVRLGQIETTSLIARRIGSNRRVACASGSYLAKFGAPNVPADLLSHNCLAFNYDRANRVWLFASQTETERVHVRGNLRVNNSIVLKQQVLQGSGIGLLPVWLVEEDLQSGALSPLLTEWQVTPSTPGDIHAVYIPNRKGAPKVQAFVDFLVDECAGLPSDA